MNIIKNKFVVFLIFSLLFSSMLIFNVSGAEKNEFVTVPISDTEKLKIWENIDISPILNQASSNNIEPIVSFDVSQKETIVLGLQNNVILITDIEGTPLQSFIFNCDGKFYVQWKGDNILLYLVRPSIIAELTFEGQLVDLAKIDDSNENNYDFWNDLKTNEIIINETRYVARNKMGIFNLFLSTYSQLIKIDSFEKASILYDVNIQQTIKSILLTFMIIVFLLLVFVVIFPKKIRPIRKTIEGTTRQTNYGKTD